MKSLLRSPLAFLFIGVLLGILLSSLWTHRHTETMKLKHLFGVVAMVLTLHVAAPQAAQAQTTIVSQNWDGATAPARPAGWTFSSTNMVTSTAHALSSPNGLVDSTVGAVTFADSNTIDGNGGNVIISSNVYFTATSTSYGTQGRMSSVTSPQNCYSVQVSLPTASAPGIQMSKTVAGTGAYFGSPVGAASFVINTWYTIRLILNGTALSAQAIRQSDGFYLSSSGTWQAGATSCIAVTDAAVTGQGYAGLYLYSNGSQIYTDDFLETTYVNPSSFAAAPTSIVAGTSGNTVTLTGTATAWTGATTFSLTSTGTGASITAQSINAATQVATLTVTAGTAGTLTYTDSTDAFTAAQGVTVPVTTISVNNANWRWSPYNWADNGAATTLAANNLKSDATAAITTASGAYFKAGFTGTTCKMSFTCAATGALPLARWSIDGGPWKGYLGTVDAALPANTNLVDMLNGTTLAAGSHSIYFFVTYINNLLDRWTANPPAGSFTINSMQIDNGGTLVDASTLAAPIKLANFSSPAYIVGDSWVDNGGITAYAGWAQNYIQSQGDGGTVGWSGQGWAVAGQSGVPVFSSTWSNFWSGKSRLFSGKLSPIPGVFIADQGENDANSGNVASVITTAVQAFLSSARAAVNTNTPIVLIVPASGYPAARTGLLNASSWTLRKTIGFTDIYQHGTDAATWLIDPTQHGSPFASEFAVSSPSRISSDTYHPIDQATHGQFESAVSAAVSWIQNGSATTTGTKRRLQ